MKSLAKMKGLCDQSAFSFKHGREAIIFINKRLLDPLEEVLGLQRTGRFPITPREASRVFFAAGLELQVDRGGTETPETILVLFAVEKSEITFFFFRGFFEFLDLGVNCDLGKHFGQVKAEGVTWPWTEG